MHSKSMRNIIRNKALANHTSYRGCAQVLVQFVCVNYLFGRVGLGVSPFSPVLSNNEYSGTQQWRLIVSSLLKKKN